MKAGKEFVVPLPGPAIDILRHLRDRRSAASPFVFASPSKPTKPISENTMAKVLSGFYSDATVHGMRSVFRDWAETFAEARREVKEYALAHSNANKIESAYPTRPSPRWPSSAPSAAASTRPMAGSASASSRCAW